MPQPENPRVFRLVNNPDNLDLKSVSDLLEIVGMRQRNPAEMLKAIQASTQVIAAYLPSGALVGFGRLISDGVFYGTIWDIAVDPAYQKLGIGSAIMNELLTTSRRMGLYMVGLFTAAHNWHFYEHLGFVVIPDVHPMRLQLDLLSAKSH